MSSLLAEGPLDQVVGFLISKMPDDGFRIEGSLKENTQIPVPRVNKPVPKGKYHPV